MQSLQNKKSEIIQRQISCMNTVYFMISFCVVLYYSTSYVLTYYCISNLVNNVLPFNLIYHIGKGVPNLNRIERGINVTHEKLVVSLHLLE